MEVEDCCGRVCSAFRLVLFSDHELRGWSTERFRAVAGTATICAVTAKERLLERVRGLSEAEAAETLRLLDARQDPLNRRLDDAPLEDEDISPEEEASVQEARDELAAGAESISHEEIRRELGIT